MRLLLDTHVLLWWMEGDDQLAPKVRELIRDSRNDVLMSVVSLWEIVVKARIGKLRTDVRRIARLADEDGFALLGISLEHLLTLSELPLHHRDPFDHLLIAQAIAEEAAFVSADRTAGRYPVRLLAAH